MQYFPYSAPYLYACRLVVPFFLCQRLMPFFQPHMVDNKDIMLFSKLSIYDFIKFITKGIDTISIKNPINIFIGKAIINTLISCATFVINPNATTDNNKTNNAGADILMPIKKRDLKMSSTFISVTVV